MSQKEEYKKQFNLKKKAELITKLSELLPEFEPTISIQDYLKKYKKKKVAIFNGNSVLCIIGKTERAKILLYDFYQGEQKVPKLDYNKIESQGRYSTYYIYQIMNFLNILNDDVYFGSYEGFSIISGKDYPLTIETPDFDFLLAPRGED